MQIDQYNMGDLKDKTNIYNLNTPLNFINIKVIWISFRFYLNYNLLEYK